MGRRALVTLAAAVAATGIQGTGTASAAWSKPGTCRVPDNQRASFAELRKADVRFSTTKVPCYMAAFAIDGLVADGKAWRSSFRHTATGARWYVKLSCRGRDDDGRRAVTCRVTKGVDGENDRSLTSGRIRWTMKPR